MSAARDGREECAVEFDPRLVEECVLLEVEHGTREERRAFRCERDPVYRVADAEEREGHFRSLHARWFRRLRLDAPVFDALRADPQVQRGCSRCVVVPARSARDEGADLHAARGAGGGAGPVLLIRLRPRTFLEPDRLARLLLRELLHVSDMLDPSFGYDPKALAAPAGDAGTPVENLLRDRYRALWDASVDGRLVREGVLPPEVEDDRRREFLAAFPMLDSRAEEQFARFFHGPRPSHPELRAFAARPPVVLERGA